MKSTSSRLLAGVVSAGLLVWLGAFAHAAERPNILVFLSDDQSAPHLGCYDNPDLNTPHLDKFAAQGMRFDRAYVACPQCVPSRASIMTGRSPVRIGMTRFSAPLPAEVVTYPELLRQAGYFTGVAGRTYHLDGSQNDAGLSDDIFKKYNLRTFERRLDYVKVVAKLAEKVTFNEAVLAQFGEFLDRVPKGKPFFLQLCTSDPHRPFDGKDIPAPRRDPAKLKLPAWFPDTPEVRKDLADYYDEISRMDKAFGQAMAELDKRGLTGKTLVMFMGDNGASQLRGKGTLYEYGIHVPLLVRWPGVLKPGGATAELVSGEDLGPTALQAAGLKTPDGWTGRSFLPLLRGEKFAGRTAVFAERGAHGSSLPGNTAGFDLGRVVVSKTHKLIYNALFQQPYLPVDFWQGAAWESVVKAAQEGKVPAGLIPFYTGKPRPLFELYDLVNDPDELNNLADSPAAAAVELELKGTLQEWMILERDYLPLPLKSEGKKKHEGKTKPPVENN